MFYKTSKSKNKMKRKLPLLLLACYCSICISQNKTCNTPEEDNLVDLNSISITKCSADKKEINNRKVTSIPDKDRIAHYVRKKKTSTTTKNNIKSHTLLFSSVDEIPLLPGCYSNKDRKCFKNKIYKHFEKNFHPENASDDGIDGRVFVQFTINTKGDIESIYTKGPKNATRLETEVKRVIQKLPAFIPGKHQGFPVSIKYGLPLTFHTN